MRRYNTTALCNTVGTGTLRYCGLYVSTNESRLRIPIIHPDGRPRAFLFCRIPPCLDAVVEVLILRRQLGGGAQAGARADRATHGSDAQPALVIGRHWLTTIPRYLSVPVPAVLHNAVVLYRRTITFSYIVSTNHKSRWRIPTARGYAITRTGRCTR